jgi:prevent-host-death family protein
MEITMKTMAAGKFKETCLSVMEEVHETREPVVITKRGRPIAKLIPAEPAKDVFGCLRGTMEIVGDVEAPVIPLEEWESLR